MKKVIFIVCLFLSAVSLFAIKKKPEKNPLEALAEAGIFFEPIEEYLSFYENKKYVGDKKLLEEYAKCLKKKNKEYKDPSYFTIIDNDLGYSVFLGDSGLELFFEEDLYKFMRKKILMMTRTGIVKNSYEIGYMLGSSYVNILNRDDAIVEKSWKDGYTTRMEDLSKILNISFESLIYGYKDGTEDAFIKNAIRKSKK